MKNLFKLYREWRNRKFVEKINRVYFQQDNAGNLFLEGHLHVVKKGNAQGNITIHLTQNIQDVLLNIS